MEKKLKTIWKGTRTKGFFIGLMYSMILIIPSLIPFVIVSFYDTEAVIRDGDYRVEITRDSLDKDFPKFTPRKILQVGMYISDLYDLSLADRSVGASLTYWTKNYFDKSKNDRSKIGDDSVKFVNSALLRVNQRAKRFVKGSDPKDGFVSYISYDGRGVFENDYFLENYPFDKHKLSFVFESKEGSAEDVLLTADPNSSLSSGNSLGEWTVKSFKGYSEVNPAMSDFSDPDNINSGALWTYVPSVVFEVEVERNLLSHFLKSLLPLFITLLMAYTNLYVRPSDFDSRSKAAFTSFLTIAALHWAASGMETGVSYLTAMDQFFLSGYALVFFLIIESVFSRALCDEKHEEENLETHPWFVYGMQIIRVLYPIALVGSWYLIIVNAMG